MPIIVARFFLLLSPFFFIYLIIFIFFKRYANFGPYNSSAFFAADVTSATGTAGNDKTNVKINRIDILCF
jgi:hypothetical protein